MQISGGMMQKQENAEEYARRLGFPSFHAYNIDLLARVQARKEAILSPLKGDPLHETVYIMEMALDDLRVLLNSIPVRSRPLGMSALEAALEVVWSQ